MVSKTLLKTFFFFKAIVRNLKFEASDFVSYIVINLRNAINYIFKQYLALP